MVKFLIPGIPLVRWNKIPQLFKSCVLSNSKQMHCYSTTNPTKSFEYFCYIFWYCPIMFHVFCMQILCNALASFYAKCNKSREYVMFMSYCSYVWSKVGKWKLLPCLCLIPFFKVLDKYFPNSAASQVVWTNPLQTTHSITNLNAF